MYSANIEEVRPMSQSSSRQAQAQTQEQRGEVSTDVLLLFLTTEHVSGRICLEWEKPIWDILLPRPSM